MIFNLSIDDLSPAIDDTECFKWLYKLIEEYPDFKVDLFVVPCFRLIYRRYLYHCIYEKKYSDWIERYRNLSQRNFEICSHGHTHVNLNYSYSGKGYWNEFLDFTKAEARKRINSFEQAFARAKLPIVKVFKAPGWRMSNGSSEVLTELGYKIIQNPTHIRIGDVCVGQQRNRYLYGLHVSDWLGSIENPLDEEHYNKIKQIIEEYDNVEFKFLSDECIN